MSKDSKVKEIQKEVNTKDEEISVKEKEVSVKEKTDVFADTPEEILKILGLTD